MSTGPDGKDTPARPIALSGAAVTAVLLALALVGCGGSAERSPGSAASSSSVTATATATATTTATTTTTSAVAALPPVCAPAARAVIARVFGRPVSARPGESGQATPQCVFRVGGRVRVTVLVDGFPQPYQRLERTQIEDAQQFGTRRLEALPTPVGSLGIDAYWFPTERKVMTTEGRRLISVFVIRGGWPTRRIRRMAVAVARHYLGPNDFKAADPNGS